MKSLIMNESRPEGERCCTTFRATGNTTNHLYFREHRNVNGVPVPVVPQAVLHVVHKENHDT